MTERLNVGYSLWKQVADSNEFTAYRYNSTAQVCVAWCGNRDYVYRTEIDEDQLSTFETDFPNAVVVATEDEAYVQILGLNVKAQPRDADGRPSYVPAHRNGNKAQKYSVNYADKRTWYQEATEVTGETMVTGDLGIGFVWKLNAPGSIVDPRHGLIPFEASGNAPTLEDTYGYVVYVDGTPATEHPRNLDGSYDTGTGDYGINTSTGTVTFASTQAGNTITIDYFLPVSSEFLVIPDPGTKLTLIEAELQFSTDISMRDDLRFALEGQVGKYPDLDVAWNGFTATIGACPAACTWNGTATVITSDTTGVAVGNYISLDSGNPAAPNPWYEVESIVTDTSYTVKAHTSVALTGYWPTGTDLTYLVAGPRVAPTNLESPTGYGILPYGYYYILNSNMYRTVLDIVTESNLSWPVIMKTDNPVPSWRDLQQDLQIFAWDYSKQAAIELYDTWGMRVRIWLDNHTPAEGWAAVLTLYATVDPDPYA